MCSIVSWRVMWSFVNGKIVMWHMTVFLVILRDHEVSQQASKSSLLLGLTFQGADIPSRGGSGRSVVTHIWSSSCILWMDWLTVVSSTLLWERFSCLPGQWFIFSLFGKIAIVWFLQSFPLFHMILTLPPVTGIFRIWDSVKPYHDPFQEMDVSFFFWSFWGKIFLKYQLYKINI